MTRRIRPGSSCDHFWRCVSLVLAMRIAWLILAHARFGPSSSSYLLLRRSRRMASSASMISSRDARLLLKLSFRLKAFVGGRNATHVIIIPILGYSGKRRAGVLVFVVVTSSCSDAATPNV